MDVVFYGRLAELTGCTTLHPEDVTDTDQLKQKLFGLYPAIANIPFAIAVNNQIVQGNSSILINDTVALLPPFSGG
ncbi:MAG TPA: MoaD/ThiS family protein [Bacteroidales bacterium]|nr:MoaD/ThiS family protein [Bacteroidales bacterium]